MVYLNMSGCGKMSTILNDTYLVKIDSSVVSDEMMNERINAKIRMLMNGALRSSTISPRHWMINLFQIDGVHFWVLSFRVGSLSLEELERTMKSIATVMQFTPGGSVSMSLHPIQDDEYVQRLKQYVEENDIIDTDYFAPCMFWKSAYIADPSFVAL